MRVSEAKELFRSLTQRYFSGAQVTFARQSRVAKPSLPLVAITPGNVKRQRDSICQTLNGVEVAHYPSRISIQIDLFTNGAPVIDDETGKTVAYENTAMDDMLAFVDFLCSPYTVDWCREHDLSVAIDGDVQDLTGLVNDNNYEFRSRLAVLLHFIQKAVGRTGVLNESSVMYPTDKVDEETGAPIYTTEEPKQTESTTGRPPDSEVSIAGGIVAPKFEETPSGGGTEELASQATGYFTEVEIKEEIGNE